MESLHPDRGRHRAAKPAPRPRRATGGASSSPPQIDGTDRVDSPNPNIQPRGHTGESGASFGRDTQ